MAIDAKVEKPTILGTSQASITEEITREGDGNQHVDLSDQLRNCQPTDVSLDCGLESQRTAALGHLDGEASPAHAAVPRSLCSIVTPDAHARKPHPYQKMSSSNR
jgi:hypothetical protein